MKKPDLKKKTPEPGESSQVRILLVSLPYWSPLIPPMGISCLKSYLQNHGYYVKTADANTAVEFMELYTAYFDRLKAIVPEEKQGNFFSIGHDVLGNHMMACLNSKGETGYMSLIKMLIEKTYFCDSPDRQVAELNDIVEMFYTRLSGYVLRLLRKESPSVLGLSVFSGSLAPSLYAFKMTREKFPHIRTVMGGGIFCDQLAIGTPNFEKLLNMTESYLDNIIVGEGEYLFLKLLRGEFTREKRVYALRDINMETVDIERLDIPDFSDYNLEVYPYLSAYTSRSCPFQCKFCSDTVMWGKYRKKKAGQIILELTSLNEKYGHQLFMMSDLLLNPVVTELSEAFLETDISLYWDGCLRACQDACDIEKTLLWRRGGFYRARLGLESGSERVLKLMGKRITVDEMKASVANLALAGIQTTTYWVVGYPGETEEDFRQTLDLVEELKDDIYEAEPRPFYYYLSGQAGSGQWGDGSKRMPLYPEAAADMLVFRTWILAGEPSREETYRRVGRFVEHCRKLGVFNPYSLQDTYNADRRWKRLHKNAVPSLLEFKNKSIYIDECKQISPLHFAHTPLQGDVEFCF